MRIVTKLSTLLTRLHSACWMQYRTTISHKTGISHDVIVSQSHNIYHNLALEDWLYENTDLQTQSMLLLWRDDPCVVIGRHQNPWVECNVPYCEKHDVKVARRKSGGGTVYHDVGNMNCSFITDRALYDRKHNLQLVVNALRSRWSLPLTINERDDIILYGKYKVSGTAAKLARNKAYHHFTLLFNIDKIRLKSILYTNMEGVSSKATQSVRMSVANLADHIVDIDYQTIIHAITETYAQQHQSCSVRYVDPTDESVFPGMSKHIEELTSHEWVFNKTPPFSIQRRFSATLCNVNTVIDVALDVQKGSVHYPKINILQCLGIDATAIKDLSVGLHGVQFDRKCVASALSDVKMTWISKQVYDVRTQEFLDWLLLCVMDTIGLFR